MSHTDKIIKKNEKKNVKLLILLNRQRKKEMELVKKKN